MIDGNLCDIPTTVLNRARHGAKGEELAELIRASADPDATNLILIAIYEEVRRATLIIHNERILKSCDYVKHPV